MLILVYVDTLCAFFFSLQKTKRSSKVEIGTTTEADMDEWLQVFINLHNWRMFNSKIGMLSFHLITFVFIQFCVISASTLNCWSFSFGFCCLGNCLCSIAIKQVQEKEVEHIILPNCLEHGFLGGVGSFWQLSLINSWKKSGVIEVVYYLISTFRLFIIQHIGVMEKECIYKAHFWLNHFLYCLLRELSTFFPPFYYLLYLNCYCFFPFSCLK